MARRNKFIWIVTFIIAGLFLFLALIGGNWGTTSAAGQTPSPSPFIDHIIPELVLARSTDEVMIIVGGNFGTTPQPVGVWFNNTQKTAIIQPLEVLENGVSVEISDTLMTEPAIYQVSVIKSRPGTVPRLTPNPTWDDVTNHVTFSVVEGKYIYLPFINR